MRLAMTLKVRDEADVLDANLRYHLAQGVDVVIATDNGSVDGSREILRRYEAAGRLRLIEEPAGDFEHSGRRWVTRMARMAATDLGADWVIHTDADEFWWPVGGSLKDVLAAVPDPYSLVQVPRPEFLGRPDGPGGWPERLVVREARSRLRLKVAHRARPDVAIGRGAHRVRVAGGDERGRPPGRAVLRAVSEAASAEAPAFVPAPVWPIRILHFPLRSFEQYRRRVEVNLDGSFDETPRRRVLREHYEQGRLPELYAQLVADDADVQAGLRAGTLVEDHGLREFLARCPDPLAGSATAPPGGPADPAAVEADLATIRLDVMQTLARGEELAARRRVKRHRRIKSLKASVRELRGRTLELERERDRLAARVEALEATPWRRARAAAARLARRP
jgi:hypothetical protein